MRILGLLLIIMFCMMAIGDNIAYFIDPTSLIIVFDIVIGVRYFGISKQRSRHITIKNLFAYSKLSPDVRFTISEELFILARAARYSGVVGTLMGAVIMLINLADPESIGPALAVAILTMFYGITLSELFLVPLANKIGNIELEFSEEPV